METNIEEVNEGVFRLSGTGKEIQLTLADIQNLSISANKYDFDNDDMLIHNFRGKCISYYSLVFDFYYKYIFIPEYLSEMETHNFLYVDNVERTFDKISPLSFSKIQDAIRCTSGKKYEYSVFNERGRYVGDKKKYIHNPGFSKLLYFLDFNNYFVSTRNQY